MYAERFRKLGVPAERIEITGTMKYDNINTEDVGRLRAEVKAALRLEDRTRVLMGGSTHPTEEETLFHIFGRLRREFPEYRLVLAPRHPERLNDVEARLRRLGATVIRKTRIDAGESADPGAVLLIDTMGELARMYAAADLVFVGGSLIPHGGQNMMEPAGLGRAVLFGPHIRNFQESVDILLDGHAAVMVRDAAHLERAIFEFARNPAMAAETGERAQRVMRDQKGASERILSLIRSFLEPSAGESAG
jgi:3-deoxy-D-manno-octulosonic-acid transferase